MLAGRFQGGTSAMSWPSIRIRPEVGVSNPASMRRSVVLPQPDGPKQREELALVDVEADIVDRVDVAILLDDVLDLDERLGVRVLPGLDPLPLVGAQPGRGGGWPITFLDLRAHCPRPFRLAQLPVTSLVQSRVTVRCVR